jgi:hypothetical protein
MVANFRYKAKEADKMIRGLLIRADTWLETEARLPLSEAEELGLKIETRVGEEFKKLEDVLVAEAKAAGHLIPSLGKKLENFVKKEFGEESEASEAVVAPTIDAKPVEPVTEPAAEPAEDVAPSTDTAEAPADQTPPETSPDGESAAQA